MGLFDAISGGPDQNSNPYAPQRGLFGVFDNSQASRMLMASSILQAVSNNAQHNQAPNMMALNKQETTQKDLEKKYNAAMRYADKLEKSNPDMAANIRADWTLAAYAQKKKMDYDLDPLAQARADLASAKTGAIENRQQIMSEFFPKQPASASPGTPPQAQVPPAAPVGTSPPTVAVGGTAPVMTPEGVPTATPLAFGSNMPPAPPPQAPVPAQQPAPVLAQTLAAGVSPEVAQSSQYIKFNQMLPRGAKPLDAGEFQQMQTAVKSGFLSTDGNPLKSVNAQVNRILDNRRSRVEEGRKAQEFAEPRDNIPEMQQFLRDNNYPGIEALGNDPKAHREAVNEVVKQQNDPATQGAIKIAETLAPGDEAFKEIAKYNPEIAIKLYKDKMDAAGDPAKMVRNEWFGDKVERKFEAGKPVSAKLVSWKPTPENIRELETKTGLFNLSRRDATRLKNADDPRVMAEKIFDEQTSTADKREKIAMHLRDAYKKDVAGADKAMEAGRRIKSMMEAGAKGLRENPARSLAIIYDYVKALDSDSAVKEGEVQMSKDIATLREELERWYTSMGIKPGDKGAAVPVNVAIDLAQTTARLADLAQDSKARIQREYSDYASDYGVDNPAKVIGRPHNKENYSLEENIDPRAQVPNRDTLKNAEAAARAAAANDPVDPYSNSGYD